MENIIYEAHSGIRWLVVLMTIIAFGWLLFQLIRNKMYDKRTYQVMLVWSSLIGFQWILGVIVFLVLGGFDLGYRWEHTVTMTLALAAAHLHIPLKKRPDRIRYLGGLGAIILVGVLVFVGVARLPQGWEEFGITMYEAFTSPHIFYAL